MKRREAPAHFHTELRERLARRTRRRSAFPVRLIPAFALSTISVLFVGVIVYFLLLQYSADVPPSLPSGLPDSSAPVIEDFPPVEPEGAEVLHDGMPLPNGLQERKPPADEAVRIGQDADPRVLPGVELRLERSPAIIPDTSAKPDSPIVVPDSLHLQHDSLRVRDELPH